MNELARSIFSLLDELCAREGLPGYHSTVATFVCRASPASGTYEFELVMVHEPISDFAAVEDDRLEIHVEPDSVVVAEQHYENDWTLVENQIRDFFEAHWREAPELMAGGSNDE